MERRVQGCTNEERRWMNEMSMYQLNGRVMVVREKSPFQSCCMYSTCAVDQRGRGQLQSRSDTRGENEVYTTPCWQCIASFIQPGIDEPFRIFSSRSTKRGTVTNLPGRVSVTMKLRFSIIYRMHGPVECVLVYGYIETACP